MGSYWEETGLNQQQYDYLRQFIPYQGECENPALELLRIVSRAYHNTYNNGGGNGFLYQQAIDAIMAYEEKPRSDPYRFVLGFSTMEYESFFGTLGYLVIDFLVDEETDPGFFRLLEYCLDEVIMYAYKCVKLLPEEKYRELINSTWEGKKEDKELVSDWTFFGYAWRVFFEWHRVGVTDVIKADILIRLGIDPKKLPTDAGYLYNEGTWDLDEFLDHVKDSIGRDK